MLESHMNMLERSKAAALSSIDWDTTNYSVAHAQLAQEKQVVAGDTGGGPEVVRRIMKGIELVVNRISEEYLCIDKLDDKIASCLCTKRENQVKLDILREDVERAEIAHVVAIRVEHIMARLRMGRECALQYIHRVPASFIRSYWYGYYLAIMCMGLYRDQLSGNHGCYEKIMHFDKTCKAIRKFMKNVFTRSTIFQGHANGFDHVSGFYATLRRIDDIKQLGHYKRFMHFHVECGIDSTTPSER